MVGGGNNKIDLNGKIFGGLTVLREVAPSPRGLTNWECLCECGNIYITSGYYLRQGRKKSCGCRNYRRRGSTNPKWSGYQDISGSYWHRVRQGAKNRKIVLQISIEDAWNQYIKQDKKCALSGIPIYMCTSDALNRSDLSTQTASLDRIDSKKGYVVDNIQWTHKDINIIKMDLDQDYFITLCKQVANYNN